MEEEKIIWKDEFKKITKKTNSTMFFLTPIFLFGSFFAIILTTSIFQLISFEIILFLLYLSSIQDFNDKEVFGFLLTPISFLSLFYINNSFNNDLFLIISNIINNLIIGTSIVLFIYTLSLFLSVILRKETMGTGDYPIFFAMGIILGIDGIGIGLLIMSLSSIIYKIITKNELIPLIPFLFFAIVSTLYIKEIIL
jgi:prepilin signal peptidase PulO-like enzyme (type II secretory pathway)